MEKTVWKEVPGNPKYKISDSGEVLTVSTGKIRRGCINPRGRMRIKLQTDVKGKATAHYIHVLVAETFIENPNNYPYVLHKNGNYQDNTVKNLYWSPTNIDENTKKPVQNNGYKTLVFDENKTKLLNIFKTAKECANVYKVDYKNLCKLCTTGGGKMKGYYFEYQYDSIEKFIELPDEIWAYADKYDVEVSDYGRVKFDNGNITYGYNNGKGYRTITCLNKTKQVFVHRLVAEYFIPNDNNLPEVNHIDCNTSNNCVSNLE